MIARALVIPYVALLTLPASGIGAQAAADSTTAQWRAWAFSRAGPARTSALLVTGAAGIARATPISIPSSNHQLAAAFDLGAHANYVVAGLGLTVSGVVGSANATYIALSLGAELGWFGRHS